MIQFMGVEEQHIRQMAVLLAKRHERERKFFPYFPAEFEEFDEAETVLRKILERPYISGIVAVRGIDVIGYLLYEFKESVERGRYVWMDYESIAIKESEHPRLLRLLYADAGAEWVKNGYFHHVMMVPLGDRKIVAEWLDQSFRYEQKYAVLPLKDFEPQTLTPLPNLVFRKGSGEDGPLLKKMALWNSIHQASAPSWLPITKETMEDIKSSYEELSADGDAYLWLGQQGERVAGFHVYFRKADPLSLVAPMNCVELPAASTNPDLRGKGVGKVMANYCFSELKKEGFDYIFADWHSPNHLASYFWPKLGFQPVMVRMSRQIDPRISWAHGR
ncbi:GNAT family N-acetyltransferase [Planococcus shenhongbingii]|uniref:GNAT family N-acetyltransferase n=1 Tax=Planococcus shenhongbingii TaxID=3058398 RepID=UPI0026298B6A|nr:GNAT family N-acetyltransferase [Planococcus sp. N016]WKA58983.1 GNAT family N-acetyltransferase [Planococcus sp. N016]